MQRRPCGPWPLSGEAAPSPTGKSKHRTFPSQCQSVRAATGSVHPSGASERGSTSVNKAFRYWKKDLMPSEIRSQIVSCPKSRRRRRRRPPDEKMSKVVESIRNSCSAALPAQMGPISHVNLEDGVKTSVLNQRSWSGLHPERNCRAG